MITGNGTLKKKRAMKAAAASARMVLFFKARRPTRSTASITITSTAAFSPKNRPWTTVTLPSTT